MNKSPIKVRCHNGDLWVYRNPGDFVVMEIDSEEKSVFVNREKVIDALRESKHADK